HLIREGEAHPSGDLGRDGTLVPLALGRVVELELGAVGRPALPPGRERRVARPDRENPLALERVGVGGGAVGCRGWGGGARAAGRGRPGGTDRRVVFRAGGEQQGTDDEEGERLAHRANP